MSFLDKIKQTTHKAAGPLAGALQQATHSAPQAPLIPTPVAPQRVGSHAGNSSDVAAILQSVTPQPGTHAAKYEQPLLIGFFQPKQGEWVPFFVEEHEYMAKQMIAADAMRSRSRFDTVQYPKTMEHPFMYGMVVHFIDGYHEVKVDELKRITAAFRAGEMKVDVSGGMPKLLAARVEAQKVEAAKAAAPAAVEAEHHPVNNVVSHPASSAAVAAVAAVAMPVASQALEKVVPAPKDKAGISKDWKEGASDYIDMHALSQQELEAEAMDAVKLAEEEGALDDASYGYSEELPDHLKDRI